MTFTGAGLIVSFAAAGLLSTLLTTGLLSLLMAGVWLAAGKTGLDTTSAAAATADFELAPVGLLWTTVAGLGLAATGSLSTLLSACRLAVTGLVVNSEGSCLFLL